MYWMEYRSELSLAAVEFIFHHYCSVHFSHHESALLTNATFEYF